MNGWHVLITGGSSGIGYSIAEKLIAKGAFVHLIARGETGLSAAREKLGERAFVYPCDLVDHDQRRAMVKSVAAATDGRLDGVVVNAAKYDAKPALEMTPAELESYFRLNTFSALHLVQETHEMLKRGEGKSVLFISSTLGARPVPGISAYAASKAALNSLTVSLAQELAGDKIRVNAILPGVVDTPIHDPKGTNDPSRAEKMAALAPLHILGRVGQPEDVANASVFMLSKEAGWVTGSRFFVDGGISVA